MTRDLKQFLENNFLTTARDFDLFQRMSLRYNPGLEQFVKNEFLHNGLGLRFFFGKQHFNYDPGLELF